MKLLIDFGNSRVKWASLELAEKIDPGDAINHQGDSLEKKIRNIIRALPIQSCSEIHAASVLGDKFNTAFMQVVLDEFNVQTKFYCSQKNAFNVTLAYANPTTYGADRYAALIAAAHIEKGSKIIIDVGTAVTIDVINGDNVHLGGLIFPGLAPMCSALNKAEGIGHDILPTKIEYLCNTTQSAVYSGSVLCLRHGIEGILKNITSKINSEIMLLLTGGGAKILLEESGHNYVFHNHLVLKGVEIMQRN